MLLSGKLLYKFTLIVWLITTHLTSLVISVDCQMEPKNDDGKLKKRLLCNYDKTVHPSLNNEAVTVTLKMILKGFSFNEDSAVMTISSWLSMTWKDDNLKWTPAEFHGITDIVESNENIWFPDLQLFNSEVSSLPTEWCKSANCVIGSSGQVSCIPPCIHTARCSADFSRWPFDTQNCTLHIGTWINAGDEVDFKVARTVIPEADLQSQNQQWKMLKVTYMRNHGNYSTTKKTHGINQFDIFVDVAANVSTITPSNIQCFSPFHVYATNIVVYSIQRRHLSQYRNVADGIGITTENSHLILLFYLAQLFLRELFKSYRLIQEVPMDMSGYYDNRAGPSNLGNVISQILLCKQITPDFNQEELHSITKDSQEINKILSEMQEYIPQQDQFLEKTSALNGDENGPWPAKRRRNSIYKNMGLLCCVSRPNYL